MIPAGLEKMALKAAAGALLDGATEMAAEMGRDLAKTLVDEGKAMLYDVEQSSLAERFVEGDAWRSNLRDGFSKLEAPEQRLDFVKEQLRLHPDLQRHDWIHINTASGLLRNVDGLAEQLKLLAAEKGSAVFRGAWSEMIMATRLEEHALSMGASDKQVAAFRKVIQLPDGGKTDLDILLKDGTVIENKWQQYLTGETAQVKIDKLATAVQDQLLVPGTDIRVTRAFVVVRGEISGPIKEYAASKGVQMIPHDSYIKAVHRMADSQS